MPVHSNLRGSTTYKAKRKQIDRTSEAMIKY